MFNITAAAYKEVGTAGLCSSVWDAVALPIWATCTPPGTGVAGVLAAMHTLPR